MPSMWQQPQSESTVQAIALVAHQTKTDPDVRFAMERPASLLTGTPAIRAE